MTDLFIVKPVVRLPQSRDSVSFRDDKKDDQRTYHGDRQTSESMKPGQYPTTSLASDKTLYIRDLSRRVSSQDVLDVLKSCDPQSVQLDLAGTFIAGYVRFAKDEDAEKAHALYNGTIFDDGSRLHLYFTDDDQEPEPSAIVLQVKNLASDVTSNDIYCLFRAFGPLAYCTVVSDEPNVDIRDSALVQFYEQEDADVAASELHGKEHHGKALAIHAMVPTTMQAPDPIDEDLNSGGALKVVYHQDSISASSVYPYAPMDRQISHPIVGQDTFSEVPTINIDFTNLYIKNLDLNIKSSDLFNLFRKFGRIISARVMNNAQTGISKGFGFVSFSKAEEAFMALQEMNGKLVLSKHVIVAYHEPKKPRSERPALVHPPTTNMIGVPPTLPHKLNPYPSAMPSPNVYDPTMPYSNNDMSRAYMQSYIPPPPPPGVIPPAPIVFRPEDQIPMQFPSQPGHMMMGYHPANGSYPPSYPYNDDYVTGSVNRIVKKYSNNALRQHQPSEGSSDTMSLQTVGAALPPSSAAPPPTGDGPSLSSLASGASVQLPPKIPLPKQKTLRRNSLESVSSVMTESSSNVQKVRMADAVRRAGETNNADDIVDMLLTLKRKERSLCLFNPDFLKEKIKLAKEALELFVDEASNNEKVYQPATSPLPTGLSRELSIERNGHNNDQFERYSNDQYRSGGGYNMHVHKPRSQQSSTSPKSTGNTSNEATRSEIDNFLASLQGYSLFEKKQKLGDRLFPLVKATGTKQAPKITIRLLDTIELNELAHLMHDKTKLKTKVDETFMVIQQ